jgi:hypothetical protein
MIVVQPQPNPINKPMLYTISDRKVTGMTTDGRKATESSGG